MYVLNQLHRKPPKGLKRKSLFKALKKTKFFQCTVGGAVQVREMQLTRSA
jgi:hypothetical protein